ncbi:hypothetical protein C2G38_2027136 [Gigaspora rosea]|uniref:Uncharacterized protein n=1 Tax=Gigaspora rosea TaxID=44941 RepID=A0A397W759_9GLOM|nr:hypothetical protein C2G38_2027136 [Gigaspora rosea]
MSFYQDNHGHTWLTGTYQWGFNDPSSWCYDYTIRNGCDEIIFNLTDWLHMEYAEASGCNGYYDDHHKGSYKKKRNSGNSLISRHEEKCSMDKWGTKPWVIKVTDLTWDCDHHGFKHKTCDGKDIYKDMTTTDHEDDEKKPKRLEDEGPETGLYLIITGEGNNVFKCSY